MIKLYSIAFLTLLIFTSSNPLVGQNQNWFFGYNAGITFNTSPTSPLTNGQLVSYEGGSGMSDKNGNLLFYTDGIKVWNRNHVQMPNGFGLLGHISSSQGVLTVQDPGDTSKYYIFTIAQLAGNDGLRYSIVDMTLQGGNGDITQKNVFVRNNLTEKLTGIIRCDGNVWIITHEWQSNKFYADLLTSSGLAPAVTSSTGVVHTGGGNNIKNTIGHMKISPQGDKLALAIRDMNTFELFDFNMTSGVISNPVTITGSYPTALGVEFSSDGTKLYTNTHISKQIFQFDLTQNGSAIASSVQLVTTSSTPIGGMQRGPDGKIYVSRNNLNDTGIPYLGVINSPSLSGTSCNYIDNGIALGGKNSRWGLPNTLEIQPKLTIAGDTSICAGDTAILIVSGSSNVQWVKGSSAATSTISVTPGSTITYSAVDPSSVCGDTVSITVKVDPGGGLQITASDTLLCPGDSVTLAASGPGATGNLQWSGNGLSSSQSTVTVSPQTTTQYYLSGGNGLCAGHDTVTIHVLQQLQAQFNYSASPCGLSVDFNSTTVGGDSYNWNFGDNSSGSGATINHVYTVPGTYRVMLQVTNADCNLTDTISEVIVVSDSVAKPEILILDNTGCMDGTINFEVENPAPRYTYEWDFDNGSYGNSIIPQAKYTNTGTYNVMLIVEDTLCGKVYRDTAMLLLDNIFTEVLIPNCFTPNEDGINEFFSISGSPCGPGDVMEIYNRWGTLVFRTENPYKEFWDGYFKGSPCSQGVYFYLFFTQDEVKRGIITLMR